MHEATLKPHRHRYWLNPKIDNPQKFKKQVKYICELHKNALRLLEQGIHLISTDEMTGIQALERLFPTKLPQLKQVEKIEFEYERHGTLSLIKILLNISRKRLRLMKKDNGFLSWINSILTNQKA